MTGYPYLSDKVRVADKPEVKNGNHRLEYDLRLLRVIFYLCFPRLHYTSWDSKAHRRPAWRP
jgi:hypothetical protein